MYGVMDAWKRHCVECEKSGEESSGESCEKRTMRTASSESLRLMNMKMPEKQTYPKPYVYFIY